MNAHCHTITSTLLALRNRSTIIRLSPLFPMSILHLFPKHPAMSIRILDDCLMSAEESHDRLYRFEKVLT